MGSIEAYTTSSGRRYRVRYRKPDRSQTNKRGFRTKRDAELFLASVEAFSRLEGPRQQCKLRCIAKRREAPLTQSLKAPSSGIGAVENSACLS